MYTAAGHFSYLEFLSPHQKFPIVRELANVARKVVSEGKFHSKSKITSMNSSPGSSTTVNRLQSTGEARSTEPFLYDVSITFDCMYAILG